MERQMNRKTTKRKEIIERDRKTKWQKRLIINSQKERETERQRDRNKQRLLFKLLLLYYLLSQARTLTIRHSFVFLSLCLSIFLSFCLFVFLFSAFLLGSNSPNMRPICNWSQIRSEENMFLNRSNKIL